MSLWGIGIRILKISPTLNLKKQHHWHDLLILITMKKHSETLFIILPFSAIILTILIAPFLFSKDHQIQVLAYESVVNIVNFKDTLISCQLYRDSLSIQFEKPIQHKHWHGEIFITKNNPREEIHIEFPEKIPHYLGKIKFTDKAVTFSKFHLLADSLQEYLIKFHASPHFPGHKAWGEPYRQGFFFYSDPNRPNYLVLDESIKDLSITTVDLVKLKNLSPDLKAFCRDSIQRSTGLTITDVKISESSYDW